MKGTERRGVVVVTFLTALLVGCATKTAWLEPGEVRLVEVAASERRWTGIAVSHDGRVFVNYPLWSPAQPFAVGELQSDGTVLPYPDEALNSWRPGKPPGDHFVCVQAMLVDAENRLWILDPGSPGLQGVIEGGAKVFVVDLARDAVVRSYGFGPEVAPRDSYLNDLRVDLETGTAYLTDSGNGALVVLDLETGRSRRLLDDHPSTHAEDVELVVGGAPWLPGGERPRVHADGIALSRDGRWLYYQALTGRTLYRVATADLRDEEVGDADLAGRVERFAESGASDGLLYGPDDCVYLSALEHDSIRRVRPDGTVETVIRDERISWPDSFALGPGNALYVTTARIHEWDRPRRPFAVYRLESD